MSKFCQSLMSASADNFGAWRCGRVDRPASYGPCMPSERRDVTAGLPGKRMAAGLPAPRMALAALTGSETNATPAARAALHAVAARAQARLGREAACAAHLAVAERQLARSRAGEEPPWIRYFTAAYLADELAHCFHDLGQPRQTQRHLGAALAGLRPSHVRRLAIDTALLASSLATAGRIDEACATARTAVDHAAATLSHRCVQRIVDVQVDLDPYRGEPEVQELGEYVRHRLPAAAV